MTGSIVFDPVMPIWLIASLFGLGMLLVLLGAVRRSRGMLLRFIVLSLLALALLDPRIIREEREPRPDIALVVVDESPSQNIADRRAQTAEALAALEKAAEAFSDLELRVVRATDGGESENDDGTSLFRALDEAMVEVPARRFAGTVMITDGQVHDVPELAGSAAEKGPLHVLLTGNRGERDRRLIIDSFPSFGLVGKDITMVFRVEDHGTGETPAGQATSAQITVRHDGGEPRPMTVRVGQPEKLTVTLEHAGQTVIELDAEPVDGELSTLNNRAAVSINGVRDRLRVLLVSGQPHAGERTWRNLLKSDPSVDLVHFTILRPPEKDDMTPLRELSLIVFPIQELFAAKLHEFNLVIFDRYMVRDVLPPAYFRNIENYVREGGALLLSVGPEFAGSRSLFHTALGNVMPGSPTGSIAEEGFRPRVSDIGNRHPVTANLVPGADPQKPEWGRWMRLIDADMRSGHSLMEGPGDRPLLILDRVEEGRVAQIMSDHTWMWSRGFENGGPYAELLRRVAHWLMKEPDLEEERLRAHVADRRLIIERGSLKPEQPPVTVTTPSGAEQDVTLAPQVHGIGRAIIEAEESGLYRIEDGEHTALAASGALNPVEFADLRATAERLENLVNASGGGISWIAEDGLPSLRRTRPDRDDAGRGWIGLTQNEAYAVIGKAPLSLMPALLVLLLALGGLMAAWYREGR